MNTSKGNGRRNVSVGMVVSVLLVCLVALPAVAAKAESKARPAPAPATTPAVTPAPAASTNKMGMPAPDTNIVAELADPADLAKMTSEELQARVQEIMKRLEEEANANSALRRDAMNLRREAEKTSPEVKAIKLEIKALNDKISQTVSKDPGVAAAMEKANACQSMMMGLSTARALILGTIARRERAQAESATNTPSGNLTTNKTDNSSNNTKLDGGRQ